MFYVNDEPNFSTRENKVVLYLAFTGMTGVSYRKRFLSLLSCLCDVFVVAFV